MENELSYALSYSKALEIQKELTARGEKGWLLFTCPPTITLGMRAKASDILASAADLEQQGVQVLSVDRGGLATYHGPGQIVGFPIGRLEDHVGDPRGVRAFIEDLQGRLAEFVRRESGCEVIESATSTAGVWIKDGKIKKVVSIGVRFGAVRTTRGETIRAIQHGFALNVQPMPNFEMIVPCGQVGQLAGSLFAVRRTDAEFWDVVKRLKECLGGV